MPSNWRAGTRLAIAWLLAIAAALAAGSGGGLRPAGRGHYDADPNHLWNRVHRHLHVRIAPDGAEYGEDEVDPLLWRETKHLLTGQSHTQAVGVLDEFLKTSGERSITDPLKHAVFQHDLWAVFDWVALRSSSYPAERRELGRRLARMIRRVALSSDQIARLPDNYAAALASRAFADRYDARHRERAFLPKLFDASGSWVEIREGFPGFEPVARQHAYELSHSAFAILVSVPGGGAATLAYLNKLWTFLQPYVADPFSNRPEHRAMLNPALPPLPQGAQVALIRRMLLVDDAGRIVRSNLTENVQLRVFREPASRADRRGFYGDQDFFEFTMRRRDLFAGESGGLRAVQPGEKGFLTFSSHGIDPFEMKPEPGRGRRFPDWVILDGCASCHGEPGIRSVLSAPRLLRPHSFFNERNLSAPWDPAVEWKARRYDWGLLQGFWQSSRGNKGLRTEG